MCADHGQIADPRQLVFHAGIGAVHQPGQHEALVIQSAKVEVLPEISMHMQAATQLIISIALGLYRILHRSRPTGRATLRNGTTALSS